MVNPLYEVLIAFIANFFFTQKAAKEEAEEEEDSSDEESPALSRLEQPIEEVAHAAKPGLPRSDSLEDLLATTEVRNIATWNLEIDSLFSIVFSLRILLGCLRFVGYFSQPPTKETQMGGRTADGDEQLP